MATITISCPHTCKIYPSCSSPKFFHTLKITYTYQKFESFYYLDGDDQIIETPHPIPITDLAQSDPINPFCNECQRAFLDFFHNKCNRPSNNLENLRMGVRKQMDRLINVKDTCACNCRGHDVVYTFEYLLKRPITDEELAVALELARLDEGLVPASERAIEAVETLDVEDLEEKVREESCCICLDGLVISETDDDNNNNNNNNNNNDDDKNDDKDDDEDNNIGNCGDVIIRRLARLPCQHMFHDECIFKWLRKCHLCPLCRFELAVDESDYEFYVESDDDEEEEEEEEDTFFDTPDDDDDDEEIFMNAFDRLLNSGIKRGRKRLILIMVILLFVILYEVVVSIIFLRS